MNVGSLQERLRNGGRTDSEPPGSTAKRARPSPEAKADIPMRPPRRLRVGGWKEFTGELMGYYEQRAKEDQLKRRVFSREKASMDRLHDTFVCEGDRILERIRRRLNSMGLIKTKPLKQIWDAILLGHMQQIYQADFVRKIPDILKHFQVKDIHQMAQILTMRQAGKTTGVQSGLAACALEIPRNKACAFAPTKRQSVAIMLGVIDFIMRSPDGANRIVRKNQEELLVTPTSGGAPHKNNPNNSMLRCLPASERGKCVCQI